MDSQNQQILDYMKSGKSITPLEALNKFECFRLASRISDLKQKGIPISSEMTYKYDDNGKVIKKYKTYWIAKGAI